MRSVVQTLTLYTYDELSSEVKEKARENIIEQYRDNDGFDEIIKEQLAMLFPDSDLKFQYSLSYCQGDGVNIYGKLSIHDLLNYLKETSGLRNNEQRLMELTSKYDEYIVLPCNLHYSYCCVDKYSIIEYLDSYIKEYAEDDFQMAQQELKILEEKVFSAFKGICYDLEKIGYEWFYEISDDEVNEIAEAYNIEFLQNGELWT